MPDSASRPLRIFLCHSSSDKPTVRELYQKLSAEGWIDVWLDEEKLLPGQDWDYEIERALDKSDAVIVTLSTDSVSKEGYVQKELRFALDIALEKPEGTIFILPVRLDDCERPRRLRPIQGIDYFPLERRELAYARLRQSLELRAQALGIVTDTTPSKPEPLPLSGDESQVRSKREITQVVKHRSTIKFAPGGHVIYTFGGMEFVEVPAGKFIMGSRSQDGAEEDEKPQHTVDIPYDYFMARFPVTNAQYAAYVNVQGITHPVSGWEKKPDHPVVNVSWQDAMAYCVWWNDLQRNELPSGVVLRLPTEAEWEKAARGTDGAIYPWGNTFDKNKCNTDEGGKNDTTPVGAYSPQGDSPYGAADMVGNVWEWTHSLFRKYPYEADDRREAEHVSGEHVQRGGSFLGTDQLARAAARYRGDPSFLDFVGFRVVVAPSILSFESTSLS
jgi:formylglycine-generating enzyme required for sulfatase activity